MDNVIIDSPERIEDDIEGFKLDCIDDESNYTAAKLKLCRDPEHHRPLVFYSQELIRPFKEEQDPFSKRHIVKVFTPSNIEAVGDETLQKKFEDSILAHKKCIPDYRPLTDIHSQKMSLFMDDDTATFLEDSGIRISGLTDDFLSIETVSATPFMEEVGEDASRLKSRLSELRSRYLLVKEQMVDEFSIPCEPKTLSDDAFDTMLANEKVSDRLVQTYLALKEQVQQIQSQLGEVENAIFSETAAKIKLPSLKKEVTLI